jgi:two-component system, cell cycle sensor histidine kinase and response regulator CckA
VFDVRDESLHTEQRAGAGRVVLLRDVHDRKAAERALQRAHEALEQRVAERTRALNEANAALEERVAEKMLVEQAALASEQRFRSLFDSAHQLMGTVAEDGTLLAANRTALEFAGVSDGAVLGRPFWEGPWWRHSVELQAELKQAIERAVSGQLAQLEVTHRGQDGTLHHFDFSIKSLARASGGPVLLLAEGHDITQLRRAEEERAELSEQLHHAQKLDSIGRLAGGIAHDFNNLLTIILGQLDLAKLQLARGMSPLHSLEQAEGAGESAAALTRQLLMFARKQPMELRVLQLNDVVSRTHRMLCRVIGEHIRLELHLEPELEHVCMDEGQLEQVLLNLAVNARDAMPDGGLLTVETGTLIAPPAHAQGLQPAHAYVRLRVSDTGSGMSPEVVARIFEPFFTTKGPGKGTGIGLSTVQGVIAQAGGIIDVTTAPGYGTTFDVILPATKGKLEREVRQDSELPRGSERVALVEDQPTVRALAQQQLGLLGYHVVPYASGEEALRELSPEVLRTIDVLVTDVVLSGMNGAALAEHLRRQRADLPVLYMSGYTDEILLSRGVDARGTHYVAKPFSLQDLAQALRRTLEAETPPQRGHT